MKLLAFDPKKNKRVLCGEIVGDTLIRIVKPEHFMRMVQGYGIQEVAFQAVMEKGLQNIMLVESKTGLEWKASVKTWLSQSKVLDYGHGKQRFLSLKFMNSKQVEPTEEQLSFLWTT